MKSRIFAAIAAIAFTTSAYAQSSPGWSYGQVPTAAQWNAAFAAKQDVLGFTPINRIGDTMMGRLNFAPSTTTGSGVRFGVGVAPTAPVNGDFWITSLGIFMRINGVSNQILTAPTSCEGYISYTSGGDLICGNVQIEKIDGFGAGVSTALQNDINSANGMIATSSLPTTLPSSAGVPWNNGGLVSISQ